MNNKLIIIFAYYCGFGSDENSASLKINRLREPCDALPIFTQLKMRKTAV